MATGTAPAGGDTRAMVLPGVLPIDLPRIGDQPARVVVADDEPDVRNLVTFKLTGAGFEVQAAAGGRRAIALIERSMPDLAILDVSMPDMSGLEVCRHLRATMRTQTLPVIMLTARTQAAQEYEGLLAGADVYMTKPFSPRALVAQVWDLLSYTRDQVP
jgi:DNA-binding response OmpR family regulator